MAEALVVTGSSTNPFCYGANTGTATTTIQSGVGPYTYAWTPNVSSTSSATGLGDGSYSVFVTDLGTGDTMTVFFDLTYQAPFMANIVSTNVTCYGASNGIALVQTSGGGGSMSNTYSWSPFGGLGNYASNLPPGTYYVTVANSYGCVATDSVTITEPPAIVMAITDTAVTCVGAADGYASVAVSGGVTPYTYDWQPGGFNTNTITGLSGGVYTITVTDSNGCTEMDSVLINEPNYQMWTGAVDTMWSNTGNWQCGVLPDISTDVYISGSAPRMPRVDISTAAANNVIINSGASLTFTGTGSKLEIAGDITNLGTYNSANGSIRFSGSGYQTIPGGTYVNIELVGSGIKISTTPVTIKGNLDLFGGYFQLGNQNLTIDSFATVNGGDAASFVLTNGNGKMLRKNIGSGGNTGQVNFPVGSAAGIYTPIAISNSGTADNFSARVINGVYSNYSNEVPLGGAIGVSSVSKTWFLTEAVTGGSNATVSVSWPVGVELPGFNNSLCDVSQYNTTNNYWESGTLSQASGTTTLFTQSKTNVTTFSPFGLSTDSNPLGITGVMLAGAYNPIKKAVDLNWKRSEDRDVASYIVERSADGITYTGISNRDAGLGEYELSDAGAAHLDAAAIFYRLRMVSFDNSRQYSNTIRVRIDKQSDNSGLVLYPNPVADGKLTVSITTATLATDMQIVVTDMVGKEVLSRTYSRGTYTPDAIELDVKQLPAGTYTLMLKQEGASVQVAHFIRK